MKTKAEIRRAIKQKKQNLSPEKIVSLSKQIIRNLLKLEEMIQARSFFIYVSFGHEVQTHDLIKKLLRRGFLVTVPKILSAKKMIASQITDWQSLKPGHFGVLEPVSQQSYKGKLEICLLPSLAVTKEGHRLGRGRGYYDRFLRRHPQIKVIAPVFNFQVIDQIPVEPTDRLVDIIVTEKKIFR